MTRTTYVRLTADADSMTYFSDVDVSLRETPFAPLAPNFGVSPRIGAAGLSFCSFPAGWSGDWHPSPNRHFFFVVSGAFEVVAGSGETRRLEPGAVLLVDDAGSHGHITRNLNDGDSIVIHVDL